MSEPVGLAFVPARGGWPAFNSQRAVWIPCPAAFPPGDNQDSWARRHAARWRVGSGTDHDGSQVARLARLLSDLREITYRPGTCHVALIYLPAALTVLPPLSVGVGVWHLEGEREARLRRLVCADDTQVIKPPAVEEFCTPALGRGLRSIRYARDGHRGVCAAVNYAFRSERHATDLRFSAACPDPARLLAAMPDIDELVQTTSLRSTARG